ncbi:MAG: serine/threonine-protein kinase [Cyanobacteriota bacterium ELA615]
MIADSHYRRLLADRYQLLELIGTGAMGQVFKAEDKLLGGVTVAVKFLSQTLLSEKMKERFEREATISALLGEKSIHIVKVRDYGIDEKEVPFYVMEFLSGASLNEIIKIHPIELKRFISLAKQICYGLDCAHRGIIFQGESSSIVHRDIKPSNILVVQDSGMGDLVKILDFGIAKLMYLNESQTQSFMGTLAYCSPEQMEGKELDNRSDIYSLGVVMYEMLTGNMPLRPEGSSFGAWYEVHHHSKPHSIAPSFKIPPQLNSLIVKCLAKSPDERPQQISELIQVLETLENQSSPRTTLSTKGNLHSITQDIFPYEIGLNTLWPGNKPIEKIVFPGLLHTPNGDVLALWTMLEEEDIVIRMSSMRYNQFIFLSNPHPMLLWITVLNHPEYGPRWLNCYLDLKTPTGQKFARTMSDNGNYWILFFALEHPGKCRQIMASPISSSQSMSLKNWANNAQTTKAGDPQASKKILKRELEKIKPKILTKLNSQMMGESTASFLRTKNGNK